MSSLKIISQQVEEEKPGRHLSWSATKDWDFCPHYYKLTKIDGINGFQGNIHTAFGNAIHTTVEQEIDCDGKDFDHAQKFLENFQNYLSLLPEEEQTLLKENKSRNKLLNEMKEQGQTLAPLLIPALKEFFKDYQIVSVEDRFYEVCSFYEEEFYFKGFIDIVVKTPDGKFHIIDWKTCGWGWDVRKRSDPMVTYQLTIYKHFFCQKYGIDPKQVETYFALCKRSDKPKDRVEIFRVTSGPRKTNNALNLLTRAVYNVDKANFIKKRTSCKSCSFRKTEHCP